MPSDENERALLEAIQLKRGRQTRDRAPDKLKQIGEWTIVALILNRTIGSGIFLLPQQVLAGAGSVGGALCLWAAGGVISVCGAYVWLECALSMPQMVPRGEVEVRGVPNSGGEKNFLEFMFPNSNLRLPHIRTTCSFAIMFLLLYNLSGNAIGFALQVMASAGLYDPAVGEVPARGPVIGIAIGALSGVILLHTLSRRVGIYINNGFAIFKVLLLLTIICLGIAKACGAFGGKGFVPNNNFTHEVWTRPQSHVSSWTDSLLLCLYSLSGFKQPFYVLAETRSPRKTFPKYVVLATLIAALLFMLVNVSYLLVVPKSKIINDDGMPTGANMAALFFEALFQGNHKTAERAMAGLIATSIFGNLWVMTFTASRVKQEIAKEGILPKSLFFATAYKTVDGLFQEYRSEVKLPPEKIEHAPTAAFGLHWFTSVFLIAVTSPITDPKQSYQLLVDLFTYAIVLVLGFWTSMGLIMIKIRRSKWHWQEGERRRYRPWLSPLHAIIYGCTTGFLAIAAFVPPGGRSPFGSSFTHLPWYVVPAIGASAPFWGVLYYYGLLIYQAVTDTHLEVIRDRHVIPDPGCPGEYVQLGEIVDHWWPIASKNGWSNNFVQQPKRQGQMDGSDSGVELDEEPGREGTGSGDRQGSAEDGRRFPDRF